MDLILVGVLVLVVLVVVVWARVAASRSDRHSMEAYGSALGALGDVSRRSDPGGSVRILPRGDAGAPPGAAGDDARSLDRGATGDPTRAAPGGDAGRPTSPDAAGRGREAGGVYDRPGGRNVSPVYPGGDPSKSGVPRATDEAGRPAPGARAERDRPRAGTERLYGSRPGAAARQGEPPPPPGRARIPSFPERRPSVSLPVSDEELAFQDRSARWAGGDRPTARAPGERVAGGRGESTRDRSSSGTQGPPRTGGAEQGAHRPSRDTEQPAAGSTDAQPDVLSDDELRRQAAIRRLSVGGVAVVGLTLIVVASLLLSSSPKRAASSGPSTTSGTNHASTTSTTVAATTTTAKPAVLNPLPNADGIVSYAVPKGPYTVAFADTGSGPCWIGVETSFGSGNFLLSNEVQSSATLTYHAKGPVAVEMGDPGVLQITINGVPAKLPSSIPSSTIDLVPPS